MAKIAGSAGVEGFGECDGYASEAELDTRKLVQEQNRKKKKSGGFQSMGLSQALFKGIMRKGYNMPTPIQRKTIPVVLEGRDVVAMARTGSGKTACFLIPLFEKLKARSAKTGARALILSPTRELALQTLKFFRELGRFTGLKAAVVLGGDSMDAQFAAVHENPDVIVATPGRFVHVCVEMELKLNSVEYVVFDEADRLFEMGFGEQLQEILKRIPENRQTLLFSATLPKLLVEFARAGLVDPVLIRLDVDTKLPEQLKLAFFHCRSEDKATVLLHLLKNIIRPKEQTLIFAATKHHVDYLYMLLEQAQIPSTFIYSSLDPTARKINAAKFHSKKTEVLIVTDVAARGIDIPLLDNVINYNFPAKAKLFVHRVGRVARAGRSGTAYSLVAPDETAYLLDLHLFLGRQMQFVPVTTGKESLYDWDGLIGAVPQSVIDEEGSTIQQWHDRLADMESMVKVCQNAYRLYLRSRPPASKESIKRVKNSAFSNIGNHPIFARSGEGGTEGETVKFLEQMKQYRPNSTIFEIGPKAGSTVVSVMKAKRDQHQNSIEKYRRKVKEQAKPALESGTSINERKRKEMEDSTETDVSEVFHTVIAPKKQNASQRPESRKKLKKHSQETLRDEQHYVRYTAPDHHTESGLSVANTFEQQASGMVLDFTGDDADMMKKQKNLSVWDQKKKKYIKMGMDLKKKKILTESGTWISASYKSNAYKHWRDRNQVDESRQDESSEEEDNSSKFNKKKGNKNLASTSGRRQNQMKGSKSPKQGGGKKAKRELQTPEEILKARRLKAIRRWRSRGKKARNNAKKK